MFAGGSHAIFLGILATLAIAVLAIARNCAEESSDTCLQVPETSEPLAQSLLQMSRRSQANTSSLIVSEVSDGVSELSWTTNIGQKHHECTGSKFDVDFTGDHSGMVVSHGMLLKKGKCKTHSNVTLPSLTQSLTCEDESTGCHMWCAPVWQSHHDTTDWGAYDERCRKWDGSFRASDDVCSQTGKVFTWARTQVPVTKNELDLNFAISDGCSSWCAPLWVTIYDSSNFAKAFRWCFNRKDDWGGCDKQENVSLNTWHDRTFLFQEFLQKHGFNAEQFTLELAVYSEFESAETLINGIKLRHVKEAKPTTPAPPPETVLEKCGSADEVCGVNHQCCRKGTSKTEATCCPKDWKCCENSCCPGYYNCTVTQFGHTCEPPKEGPPPKPLLCQL